VDELSALEAAAERLATEIERAVADGHAEAGADAPGTLEEVVRPLANARSVLGWTRTGPPEPVDAPSPGGDGVHATVGEDLWELARRVTRLRLEPGMPPDVQEATAALQDLAGRWAPAEGQDTAAARHEELAALQAAQAAALSPGARPPAGVPPVSGTRAPGASPAGSRSRCCPSGLASSCCRRMRRSPSSVCCCSGW
jgi:hypothetical protein